MPSRKRSGLAACFGSSKAERALFAFCRNEAVSVASFHFRRSKLAPKQTEIYMGKMDDDVVEGYAYAI